jgi:hypothetical protein
VVWAILKASSGRGSSDLVGLIVAAGVGVIVYPRVTSEFVRSAEAFTTARELAGMRLLACMSADVSCLVFQAVEGSVAERTLVRARQVLPLFCSRGDIVWSG